MTRLFIASIICFICFCVKSILIFIVEFNFNGEYPPALLLFYYIGSEVIPLVVMLWIFESSGKKREVEMETESDAVGYETRKKKEWNWMIKVIQWKWK